jgi:Zn-dependent protease
VGQIEIFRVGRIPVYLDFMFVLLAALWSRPYWSSGEVQLYSAGFVLVIGIFLSILLHELGHAWAGRMFGIGTRAIELNGLGGLCTFERSLPASPFARTVIGLAGPAVNLGLWLIFQALAQLSSQAGQGLPLLVMSTLAYVNFLLLVFNLLPAFPLDGGKVLEAWLAPILGGAWAVRVVSLTGFCVAAWLAWIALPGLNLWILLIAAVLAFQNFQTLQSVGGFRR